ncbi:MAG: 50S ribosomal protein L25 [Longimicrobiales bacterium]
MAKANLKAKKRDDSGKGSARTLRREGRVPAVIYGRELEPVHLSVDAHEAQKLFHSISVDNTIVDLDVEGEKKPYQTLVREIQMHPWRPVMQHVDFLRIQEGVAVDLEVPIRLSGVPAGVRLGGGVLEQMVHDLPIRCVPSKIPEAFELDVTGLEVNQSLHVSDIKLAEGVESRIPADRTICLVAIPRLVEEAVTVAPTVEGAEGAEGAAPAEGAAAAAGEGGDKDKKDKKDKD